MRTASQMFVCNQIYKFVKNGTVVPRKAILFQKTVEDLIIFFISRLTAIDSVNIVRFRFDYLLV